MSLLFESIKVVNNSLVNIGYHNARVNNSRRKLLNAMEDWDLGRLITIPELNPAIVYKCRIVYFENIVSVEFLPYNMRRIQTLKLVECPGLDYGLKYVDRSRLDAIKLSNQQADDVVIVKNNWVTDCSFANIVFFDGVKWITPATPLLKGTKRQKYIDEQSIIEQDIKVADLTLFTKARLINAMVDLEESPDIQIKNIFL